MLRAWGVYSLLLVRVVIILCCPYLYATGERGHRHILPNATVMIHR